ncbi:MAG TPA: TIGR01777 family oxidoreductase [Gemmatimonadales bacterium]|nr:TIGR01777 family oxidoreductase [Gemmatimonadales bacterium]
MPHSPAVVERSSRLPFPTSTVFGWHEQPGAFERLTPPWEHARVLERTGGIEDGGRVVLRIGTPIGLRWVARHLDYERDRQFADEQVEGPFARWRHLHRFEPDGASACVMTDRIEYAAPLGAAGAAGEPLLIRPRLERMLSYRHELLGRDLEAHARYAHLPRLRIAVTGASGLVGRALVPFLTTGGHTVIRLVRGHADAGEVAWNYNHGRVERAKLEGLDAIVHLAGENIAARWTTDRRRRIRESREIGTRFLAETIAYLDRPPRVFVSASAIGIYGNRGDETLTETSPTAGAPPDFLTDVAREWESATGPAADSGIRTVLARFGIVLTPAGGALGRQLPPFRLGLGGPLGSGRQYVSWIAIDDLVCAIYHALMSDTITGPVNVTAPTPVTSAEFAATLGRVLGRPAVVPVPAAALRLAFGEMADVALLSSARVLPARLLESGYSFRYPELEAALRFLLGRPRRAM